MMKFHYSYKKPWFWFVLKRFFPKIDFEKGTALTFGNTIYTKNPIVPNLEEHEKVHIWQQKGNKLFALLWCLRYIKDRDFRYRQELQAYRRQYYFIRSIWTDGHIPMLMRLSKELSGPMYGNLVSEDRAFQDIKNFQEDE